MSPLPLTGYVAPRLAALRVLLQDAVRAGLGASINVATGSVLGNLIDIVAARIDELSESSQSLYDSFDERNAEGTFLDNLCALVGVTREPATYSVWTQNLTATAAITIPAGSIIEDDSTGTQWVLLADEVFPGAGVQAADFSPALTGPIPGASTATMTIITPVADWTVADPGVNDALAGTDRETDAALRLRRRESLQISGAASVNAIRAQLRELSYVSTAIVVDNKTDYPTVVSGITLPPHSYLAVVYPSPATAAAQQAIAEAIWRAAPAGIYSASGAPVLTTYTATVTDVEGQAQTVRFSEALAAAQTIDIQITVDGTYGGIAGGGGAGDLALKAALVDMVTALDVGEAPNALDCYRTADTITGLLNVTSLTLGGAAVGDFNKATLLGAAVTITPTP